MSRTSSVAAKSAVFTVLVPGAVAGVIPGLIADTSPHAPAAVTVVGWVLIVAGAIAALWCIADFVIVGRGTPAPIDAPRELVTRGLYQFSRNPMYVAVLLVVLGQAAVRWAYTVLLYALLLWVAFDTFVRRYEEPALTAKFGTRYLEYCALVPRWLRVKK